jgi:hypothetical protein
MNHDLRASTFSTGVEPARSLREILDLALWC